jgi:hypothetical protein
MKLVHCINRITQCCYAMTLFKKDIKAILKLKINAGEASASPPVGPVISQAGLILWIFVRTLMNVLFIYKKVY